MLAHTVRYQFLAVTVIGSALAVGSSRASSFQVAPNGRYFSDAGGETYAMNGINLFFLGYRYPVGTTPQGQPWIDPYFRKLAEHGINYVRLFCEYDRGKLDDPGPGMQKIDYVLDTADRYGIKICMALFNENGDWNSPDCQWTDAQSKQIIAQYVNRWNNHPALFAWDLCNDFQMSRGSSLTEPWLNTMEPYLGSLDSRHPVFAQVNTGVSTYPHMAENVDAYSVMFYNGDMETCLTNLHDRIVAELDGPSYNGQRWPRPVFVGEARYTSSTSNPADAACTKTTLHAIWIAYTSGAAGFNLWCEDPQKGNTFPMPSEQELDYYLAMSRVLDKVDLGHHDYANDESALLVSNADVKRYAIHGGDRVFGYLRSPNGGRTSTGLSIFRLDSGAYKVEWLDPATGAVVRTDHGDAVYGGHPSLGYKLVLSPPTFDESLGLLVTRVPEPATASILLAGLTVLYRRRQARR